MWRQKTACACVRACACTHPSIIPPSYPRLQHHDRKEQSERKMHHAPYNQGALMPIALPLVRDRTQRIAPLSCELGF